MISLAHAMQTALTAMRMPITTYEGAIVLDRLQGIGGSQELDSLVFKIKDDILYVETETYIGLSIEGEESIIDNILNKLSNFQETQK